MHFRIDRSTFEIMTQTLAPFLVSDHIGGKDQIGIEKQVLLFDFVSTCRSGNTSDIIQCN